MPEHQPWRDLGCRAHKLPHARAVDILPTMLLIKGKQLWQTSGLRIAGVGRVAKGKRWHRGPLLVLIIAALVSELSGGSWWWHGEIGMTAFWRAIPLTWNTRQRPPVNSASNSLRLGETIVPQENIQNYFVIFFLTLLCHFSCNWCQRVLNMGILTWLVEDWIN